MPSKVGENNRKIGKTSVNDIIAIIARERKLFERDQPDRKRETTFTKRNDWLSE